MELAIEYSLPPVRADGFDEDVVDRLVVLVTSVEFAAALSLVQMDPVRGVVADPLEARCFAERFQQDGRTNAVGSPPVDREWSLEAAGGRAGGTLARGGGSQPTKRSCGAVFLAAAPQPSRQETVVGMREVARVDVSPLDASPRTPRVRPE